jgi:replication factor A1
MTMGADTVIEPCDESDNIPFMSLELVPISELVNRNLTDAVDIIGVVKSCDELTKIVTKAANKELSKRDMVIVDDSNCSVRCTLWGKEVK